MADFIDSTAFNYEQGQRARKLFAAVVLAALDDAIADDKKYGNGPDQIARWARSRDGREVLSCAGIDPNERVVKGLMEFVSKGVRTSVALSREEVDQAINRIMSKEIRIAEDGAFFIHPGELALAATAETITVPDDLVGWLDGRSSLARLGLMVHVTAHRIDPGWSGAIVLECYNSGKLPLALRPGMAICAISFEMLSSPAIRPYNKRLDAKYRRQTGPTPSRIGDDEPLDSGH